ncbi:MAG: sigma-70 family RNA polymerase sigma factor [Actinomycetota bacterium]
MLEKLVTKWHEPHVVVARSRSAESWRGYVITAARNALTDLRRKNGRAADRDRRATLGTDGDPLPVRPEVRRPFRPPESDTDAYLARLAVADLIAEVDLTDGERTVISLVLIEGMRHLEICRELGLSARWVRDLSRNAKLKLREHVAAVADDDD